MLINIIEHFKKDDKLRYPYRGEVVDNMDPDKLGRVKCNITNILEGSTASLPWCYPRFKTNYNFVVPEVGEFLEIRFPYSDPHFPFWYGGWHDSTSHIADFDVNYPESYGWKDLKGNKLVIDKTEGENKIEFEDAHGNKFILDKELLFELLSMVKLTVDENGKLDLISPDDIKVVSAEDSGVLLDKTGKVALGSKKGTPTTAGLTALELVAMFEKLCEKLGQEAPAGFGAPLNFAADYNTLKADATLLKGTL